jgi:hypothetical protein
MTRFPEKALAYSSVPNRLRHLYFGGDVFESGIHSGKPSDNLVDFKTLQELVLFPFHSMGALASLLETPVHEMGSSTKGTICCETFMVGSRRAR